MFVNPGQVNAAHTHEVEEVFFVLQGFLDVFLQDDSGRQVWTRLGQWECISCPPGVIHGYENRSLEPVYFQVMLGRARPELMGYARSEEHTSELQSLTRISYAVFCLKKKKKNTYIINTIRNNK